ncbi:MAG: hypothetical protein KDB03_14640 [Planctomycetales bacterium]|nr:hypothetical protein [Planctomycetales bacterium]
MSFIRRRWPFLAFFISLISYWISYYQIEGWDQLRFVLRQATEGSGQTAHPSNSPWAFDDFGTAPTHFGIDRVPRNSSASAWSELLSTGEKLALYEQQPSGDYGSSSTTNGHPAAFPFSGPLPAPADIAPGGKLGTIGLGGSVPVGTAVSTNNRVSRPYDPRATVRVASFSLAELNEQKLQLPSVLELLTQILSHYDLIALQDIVSERDDILPVIVDRINSAGGTCDYLIGPRVGRGDTFQQYAYVFDVKKLETDRYQLYSVEDPDDVMTFDPLVAWFRCKQPAENEAFTFSLINLKIQPALAEQELRILPQLVSAVQRDGRGEDDWILLGDFGSNGELGFNAIANSCRPALHSIPSTIDGAATRDNLAFSQAATSEFTGKSGAFDFLRKYNLSLQEAAKLSQHLPVWAEFSIYEGSDPGRVGAR